MEYLGRIMQEIDDKIREQRESVMSMVKSKVSSEMYDEIETIRFESENTSNFVIVDKPLGTFQTDEDIEHLDGYYVNQTIDGGMMGDEYAGTISIEIGLNEFLQFNYEM